ncbi:MAG TPA: MBL fold metallo-hydrolase [Gaiellaceae bacterium]|nr:MBL fold metallo-hydrolase [Gaiellaceae bacterium]
MLFRQILHADLGCASYIVADGGVGAIVDPKWEIEEYLELADEHGFEIRHVLETHNHADHVSGRGRLVEATGAAVHVSPTPGLTYPHETLADGEAIELGETRIVALATPGHRPEHTAYLVYDRARSDEPVAVLTGDSLFIGDVARPDLAVEAGEGARGLHGSLRRLLDLPDHVQVLPGHVGGSLCGGAGMSEAPSSTVGFERRFNPLLGLTDEEEFVASLTTGLRPQPPNFRRIVALNSGPLLREAATLEPLAPARVDELLRDGATLLDGRAPEAWAAGHVPGSVSATMVRAAVGSRAAAAVDPESPVVVTAASDEDAARMARRLEAVGFRQVLGLLAGGVDAWREAGLEVELVESIDVPELAHRLRGRLVVALDVRDADEWQDAHVPDSLHLPYHELSDTALEQLRAAENGQPYAVVCGAGNRASLAASLLRRAGVRGVVHVGGGGVSDLAGHGIELTRSAA